MKNIAQAEKDFANNNEMKQEGKYDTRKIEASYLAGAQARRVAELEMELNKFQNLPLEDYSGQSEVFLGTLVRCQKHRANGTEEVSYFLSPGMGGLQFDVNQTTIQVISKDSPIGKELLQVEVGDSFELKTKKETLEIEVLEII